MSHFRVVPSGDDTIDAAWGPAWTCQLIHSELTMWAIILDLVALERRPGPDYRCPPFVPFTITIDVPSGVEQAMVPGLRSWADSADIVRISTGRDRESRWLSIAAAEARIVVELAGR